jgi:hypothetical protein
VPISVVESTVVSKHPDRVCEDVLVATGSFVAVVDGASDPTGRVFGGRSSGCFAADVIAAAIETLPEQADARLFADRLTEAVRAAVQREAGDLDTAAPWPTASVVCVSQHHRQVWRIGPCWLAIGTQVFPATMPVDDAAYSFRAALNAAMLAAGTDLETILADDPGTAAARPLYAAQHHLANTVGRWSFGCINGRHVPDEHLEVFAIPLGADEVILASDGYSQIHPTLERTEQRLAELLVEDPAAMGPLWEMGKPLTSGGAGPDDRSYVRVQLS